MSSLPSSRVRVVVRAFTVLMAGLGLASPGVGQGRAEPPAVGSADLVLTNGRLYTLDPDRPWA